MTIREVVREEGLFSDEELNQLLNPRSMIAPVKTIKKIR
jgi:aspartate ammonia-lyase